MSGHLLLLILAGFQFAAMMGGLITFSVSLFTLVMLTAISGLELAIGGIQAFVFSILTSSYIKDSIELH